MVGNKRSVGPWTWMTCVAVIIGVVTIMVAISKCSGPDDDTEAIIVSKSSQSSSPVQVYPERGDLSDAIKIKDGRFLCGSYDGIKTRTLNLPITGGVASYNGTMISANLTEKAVAITINGSSHFVSGWAAASDGGVTPFNVPDEASGQSSPGIRLELSDFKAYLKDVIGVTLCSVG